MKALLITNRGVEETAALELGEILGKKAVVGDTVLSFDATPEELCKLSYYSQSGKRVLLLLKKQELSKVDDITLDVDLKKFIFGDTFLVECERIGEQDFKSVDVESRLIGIIGEAYGKKMSHDTPDTRFFAYVYEGMFYFGLDIGGDMQKRSYKIYSTKNSLKGQIAYDLVRESGYGGDDALLVTTCRDGIVGIEAGFFGSGKSVRFFDKDKFPFWKYNFVDEGFLNELDGKEEKTKVVAVDPSAHNVTVAKKNAKIAGVDKLIRISKMDLQWLDTKFDEESVDRVIGHLPSTSKHRDEKQTKKLFKEFFYQTSFIISKKGTIVTLTPKPDLLEETAKEYKLKKIKEKTLAQGHSTFWLMVFNK
tara:strand:+ start:276 stop:1367 length:1092 start_codon:yes stop_codon:yes gene_type:complete